jgi:primosomal protein N' (replication factor Y)
MTKTRAILVPYPVDKAYSYAVPADMALGDGDYVTVPLSGREVTGVVWGEAKDTVKPEKLKSVLFKHDCAPMPEVQRKFIDWAAHYTMSPLGFVLKMSLSVPDALDPPMAVKGYKLNPDIPPPLTGGGQEGGDLIEKAQFLRKNMTDAETKIWYALNREQMGVRFRRQEPLENYILDFVSYEKRLVIEIDGGQHSKDSAYEQKRQKFLEDANFRVLRFWNNEVLENFEGVWETLNKALLLPPPPKPSPGQGGALKLSPQQQKVVEVLQDNIPRRASEIAELAGVTSGVVKTLAAKGVLDEVEMFTPAPCRNPDINRKGADLSEAQKAIAERLCSALSPSPSIPLPSGRGKPNEERQGEGYFKAFLLDGVTGAGKTEVYFEAVAEALKNDKQVLILLPEIALSNAFLDRFQSRFGCAPALWHSHLSQGQRKTAWRGVAQGETKVVVGARSALFLPYQDLGLIIVDEEHDPAYKQEDGVIYHARDMAVVRAHLGKFPIVLVSATPSLETIQNAWSGRYEHLHLPDRFGGATLPDVHLIDLRVDKPEAAHFIAPTLKNEMIKTLQDGEQVLLFLNRRGYAPLTLCRKCGHRMNCPRCTAWLVEHKNPHKLQCHHCGYNTRPPNNCPECNEEHSLVACGPGVERIYEEVKANFPDARVMMLASDAVEDNATLKSMLDDIRDHKIDIVIGTQIIAKGHHFPNLTLVGVIDADLGLSGGELRGAERTYQLLHQVAGRAGREQKKGRVFLQTYMPEHRIMQAMAAGTRDPFLEVEALEREQAHMPPYSRLVGIIIAGRDEGQVIEVAKALGRTAPQTDSIQTLGPAPAPFARLRGKFRYRLLVRAEKSLNIQKTIAHWLKGTKIPSTVRVYIDIDPQSFV